MVIVYQALLAISVFVNISFPLIYFFFLRKKPVTQKTLDAAHILHDLTMPGEALVRISRIDPSDIFLRGTR